MKIKSKAWMTLSKKTNLLQYNINNTTFKYIMTLKVIF